MTLNAILVRNELPVKQGSVVEHVHLEHGATVVRFFEKFVAPISILQLYQLFVTRAQHCQSAPQRRLVHLWKVELNGWRRCHVRDKRALQAGTERQFRAAFNRG
jgi:hypothetical protein